MKLTVKCDSCGKEGKAEDFTSDYDGIDRCKKCHLESEIYGLERDIKAKEKWLKETHLKKLQELKAGLAKKSLALEHHNSINKP